MKGWRFIVAGWLAVMSSSGWTADLTHPADSQCVRGAGISNDGPDALDAYAGIISSLWLNPDYLKETVGSWNSPACVFDDGRPRMAALSLGYDHVFNAEKDWSKTLYHIEEMKRQYPKAAFVAQAESRYWIDYAWNARGGGYVSSVTPDGWKLFRDRMEVAEKVLLGSKAYASNLPGWYEDMIDVQSALDRPAEERDKVFLEGAARYKTFYPIYFTMLNYLTPKWGGDWETVDNFAKWSVENTKAIDGNSLYARIYWAAWGDMQRVNIFKESHASWPRMRQGFEDLMARHPNSKWNLNNFAMFACMAKDKKTFLKLRRQIGKDVVAAAWSGSFNLDLCETKFGYAE